MSLRRWRHGRGPWRRLRPVGPFGGQVVGGDSLPPVATGQVTLGRCDYQMAYPTRTRNHGKEVCPACGAEADANEIDPHGHFGSASDSCEIYGDEHFVVGDVPDQD